MGAPSALLLIQYAAALNSNPPISKKNRKIASRCSDDLLVGQAIRFAQAQNASLDKIDHYARICGLGSVGALDLALTDDT